MGEVELDTGFVDDIINQINALSTREVRALDDFTALAPFNLRTKTIGFVYRTHKQVVRKALLERIRQDSCVTACKDDSFCYVTKGASSSIQKSVMKKPMRNAIQVWFTLNGRKQYCQIWATSKTSIQVSGCNSTSQVRATIEWLEKITLLTISNVQFTIFSSQFDLGTDVPVSAMLEAISKNKESRLVLDNELSWDSAWVDATHQSGLNGRIAHPNGLYKYNLGKFGKGTIQCTDGNHAWVILTSLRNFVAEIVSKREA